MITIAYVLFYVLAYLAVGVIAVRIAKKFDADPEYFGVILWTWPAVGVFWLLVLSLACVVWVVDAMGRLAAGK
jgi:vacuolar-type H+-ATPase subunit I/STV1